LNALNLQLQGQKQTIFELIRLADNFRIETRIFISGLQNQDLSHSPSSKKRLEGEDNVKFVQFTFYCRFQDFEQFLFQMVLFNNPLKCDKESQ